MVLGFAFSLSLSFSRYFVKQDECAPESALTECFHTEITSSYGVFRKITTFSQHLFLYHRAFLLIIHYSCQRSKMENTRKAIPNQFTLHLVCLIGICIRLSVCICAYVYLFHNKNRKITQKCRNKCHHLYFPTFFFTFNRNLVHLPLRWAPFFSGGASIFFPLSKLK